MICKNKYCSENRASVTNYFKFLFVYNNIQFLLNITILHSKFYEQIFAITKKQATTQQMSTRRLCMQQQKNNNPFNFNFYFLLT